MQKQTKTELLSWNKSIHLHSISKKFYGKYLYKVMFTVYGGRALARHRLLKTEKDFIKWRKTIPSFSPLSKQVETGPDLYKIYQYNQKFPKLKIRIERWLLSYYFEDFNSMKQFLDTAPKFLIDKMSRIYSPNPKDLSALVHDDVILSTKADEFGFLVYFNYFDVKTNNLYNYLLNMRTEKSLHITDTNLEKFDVTNNCHLYGTHGVRFIYNARMYIKNIDALTFVKLIEPKSIGKIYKLVKRTK